MSIREKNFRRAACGALFAAILPAALAAQPGGEYLSDLGTLYGERYRIQAHKDVCISVLPGSRREFQSAYEEWIGRHEEVLENLEARLAAAVKSRSRDPADYERNYNRYYDAVMRRRDEEKENLRKLPKEELIRQCRGLPAYLRSADSDIYNTHPGEFEAIYGRRKP